MENKITKTFLSDFLKKFDIQQNTIEKILLNKKIVKILNNYFLVGEDIRIQKEQIFLDILIFIQLKKLLPSKYLLDIILENTHNKVNLKNQKAVDKFLFSKDLHISSIEKTHLLENSYYLVSFKNDILGVLSYEPKNKENQLKNIFNLGEYLRE